MLGGLFSALLVSAVMATGGMRPVTPRCEYRSDPIGIDVVMPRLSWKLESERRAAKQTAYQILVASSEANLKAIKGDLWDSGKVASDESIQIAYKGKRLESGQRAWWKVRAWDKQGKASGYSTASFWEMGLLNQSDWKAQWIGQKEGSDAAAYLRKAFAASKPIRSARIYASAKGLYKLYVNGQRVGNDVFTPGWTDYKKRIQYQTYEVTKLLKTGDNALGVVLGDGWYNGHIAWAGAHNYGKKTAALVQLNVTFADGTSETVASDGSWKVSAGPILASDLLMGEAYDARKEIPGWNAPGFDDSKWTDPDVQAMSESPHPDFSGTAPLLGDIPMGLERRVWLVAQYSPTVQEVLELHPKTVAEKPAGSYVFDLGQNMVGWARLKARGPAGTTVRLRFAEMLNPDGSLYTTNLRGAKATDTYTLKGDGVETFEPSFTFHGFRYVEVTGYHGVPDKDAITGIVVSSATPQAGTFECSNPLVNQLQRNIVWGQRGNYLEVPTDCPQRDERLGWMGDAQIFVRTATYNADIAAFMTKWTQDVVDAQSEAGGFADVSPRVADPADGAPAWGDAGVIVPWTVYQVYNDKRLLAERYDSMTKWINYIDSANPDHLWIKRSNNNFGDWLNVNADMPRDVLATSYFAYSTHLVAKAARVLGKTEDAQKYEALFEAIKAAYNKAYVGEDGRIKGDTQTCYVLALRFDLLPAHKRELAIHYLVTDIVDKRAGHLSTGFVGVGYLTPTLTAIGHTDVAYRLLTNETYPSWGYSIRHGATTIWERWDGWTQEKGFQDPGMNSFNHYSLGSVGEWMFSGVAGIDLDPEQPGFKHIILRPRVGGSLTSAKATYDSIHGKIVSDWKLENGALRWNIVIPANTTATVYVPLVKGGNVLESGHPAAKAEGVRFVRKEENAAVYEVGSGSYAFTME